MYRGMCKYSQSINLLYLYWDCKDLQTSRNALLIIVATETQPQIGKGINRLGYIQDLKG